MFAFMRKRTIGGKKKQALSPYDAKPKKRGESESGAYGVEIIENWNFHHNIALKKRKPLAGKCDVQEGGNKGAVIVEKRMASN